MKKLMPFLLIFVLLLHSSYSVKKGGDMFQLFWNGKQVHQQFAHVSKEIKSLQILAFSESDYLQVIYSHCGKSGQSRSLVFRGEKNEVINTFHFSDNENVHSRMTVSGKALGKTQAKKMYLYYRSKELSGEKLLAVINLSSQTVQARP